MESQYQFEHLSTKQGFNSALSHFRNVSDMVDLVEEGYNLADVLNKLLDNKEIKQDQMVPIVYALLYDKYHYRDYSHTMNLTLTDFSAIVKEVPRWKAVDIVWIYFHPDLGPLALNPKNPEHFENLHGLKENELLTIYVGSPSETDIAKAADTAIKTIAKLLDGKKSKTPDSLLKGPFKFRPFEYEAEEEEEEEEILEDEDEEDEEEETEAGETAAAASSEPSSKKRRMTPFYSIPVTNELFHNGNVEAWKKVIQSYKAKHPDLEVYIYYDGERIHDIHSLFKWGKVKHGSTILIAIAGENIQDVAKLQRYLRQGASPQFEAFLRFPVNTILNLF